MTDALVDFCLENGYLTAREMPDGRVAFASVRLFNTLVGIGSIDVPYYDDGW